MRLRRRATRIVNGGRRLRRLRKTGGIIRRGFGCFVRIFSIQFVNIFRIFRFTRVSFLRRREVVCEEMIRDEYGGEDAEDLLMTVCRPPDGTYAVIRRREKSTQSFIDENDEVENEADKSEEEFELEKSAIGYREGKSSEEEGSSTEWEKEADDGAEREYHLRGLSDRTIGYESTKGEDDLSSSIFTHGKGLLDDNLSQSKVNTRFSSLSKTLIIFTNHQKPALKKLKPARRAKKKTVKQVFVKAQVSFLSFFKSVQPRLTKTGQRSRG